MKQTQLAQLVFDQSKDLIWMVDSDIKMLYGNKAYLSLIKELAGVEKKPNDYLFTEGFSDSYIERWKAYYSRAFKGEYFEIEEHYSYPETNKIKYIQVTFEPLVGDGHKIVAVACQSKDITRIVEQRSEANQMMDASLDVFCTINEQSLFVYVSAASTKLWGYLPQELIGKPFQNFILEQDVPKTNAIAADILSGKEITYFANRYKKKDGGIAYNLWSARWDSDAKLMYCVARDGKAKIDQEEKILQSEQRFKALVQEGSDLIGVLDTDGNYIYVSPTSTTILGIAPEEFIGKSAFDFIHPEDATQVLAGLQRISTENKVIIEPFRFQNQKKEWRWVETVLTNMLDNPAVKGIVANSRDITEKVNALKEIETNELFNRTVLESSPDCFKVLDIQGRIQYMNYNGLCQMEIDDFLMVQNKNWWSFWGSENEALVKSSVDKALKGESAQFVAFCPTAKGTPKWWDVAVSPVGKPGEPIQSIVSVSRDITEQKNKELENAFLAQISINFGGTNDLLSAANGLCKSVSEFGKFDWVELWTSNFEKSQMQLFSHYVAAPEDELFYDYSRGVKALQLSEGLPGKVWYERAELLWDDIENNKDFIRRNAAKKIGLKAVLGIPLIFNNEVVGVLQVGTKHNTNYLKNYTQLFKKLQEYIGSELNRKKLENDLSHLFDAVPDIICVLDFKGKILKMNKSGCDLLGQSESDLLFHDIEEFVHAQDKNIFSNSLKDLTEENLTFKFENRCVTKAGDIVWLSWYCNSATEQGLIFATAKNIAEEKKLRELNREARSLAKIGSWELDLVNQTLYWSDEVHYLHETDPKSFVPKLETGINFYREDFREMVQLSVGNSISTGEPFDFEAVLVTTKKKEVWVRAIGNAELVDGVCTRIYGSFQDINLLKESESRLISLSENLPGIVYQYLIHPDGTDSLSSVSGSVEQVWGFTANEVLQNLNLVWNQIKAGGDFEEVEASILKSVQTKSRWTCRLKYVLPSGEVRTQLGTGTPTFLADGTVLYNSITLDITQEVKNEELLEQVTELAKIGSWEVDMIQAKPTWSKMVHSLLETDPEHYVPDMESTMSFYREDFRALAQSSLEDCIVKGIPVDFEAIMVTANKNEKWVRLLGNVEMMDGKPTRIYGSMQDINDRKHAEEKLLDSKQKYRELTRQLKLQHIHLTNAQQVAKVGSWETELSTLKVTWSDETYRIFGTDRKNFEPTHEKFLQFVHPLDRDKVGKLFTESIQNSIQSNNVIEHRIITPSGEVKVVEEYWKITYDEKGKPLLAIGSCQDITARKKAEQEKNSLQETLENSLNEIYIFDTKTLQFSYANKGALFNLGYSENEIKTLTPLDLKPNFTATSFKQLVIPLLNSENEKIVFFTNHKRKDQSLYPVEVHLQLVREGNNKRFLAIILDITERKKAEERILQANERFEKVTEATNDVIWDWDIVKQTIYRSSASQRFFGKEASRSFKAIDFWKNNFHPDDLPKIQNSIQEAIANPSTSRWELEYRVFNEHSEVLYVIDRGIIIRNSEGNAIRIVGAMTDISEHKRMTTKLNELNETLQKHAIELERSNEELEQFAFVASHDLQEPLRMISSFMDLLQRKYGDQLDEKGHQYISFATDGAKRMKQIILDLLDYSRSSRPTEGKEEVDLNEIFSEFEELRRKLISEKNASIKSNVLPTLNTYKAPVTQILHCLLDNALKYSVAGISPIVEMNAIEKEKEWEFSIKDNGIGIDPQFYDKIFVIFQRLHNKDEYSGTGIGLSIAKRHIEFLGGRIWLESKIGEGTTFYFTISKTK